MRAIKNAEYFVSVLRALETLVIFALVGLIVYSLIAGLKIEEVREHYRESHENEKRILEILENQASTSGQLEEIKDKVVE